MIRHIIFFVFLGSWICHMAISHTLPTLAIGHANQYPQFHHFNSIVQQLHQAQPLLHHYNINPSKISQRSARGLFQALSGLGNVAAAAGQNLLASKPDDDDDSPTSSLSASSSNSNKQKPYAFNDVEMTAIQAMISLRNIIGDLLHKVGVNIPSSIASLITRSESNVAGEKHSSSISPTSLLSNGGSGAGDSAASSLLSSANSKVNTMLLLRGLALSLPLLIPMANQIRRMSVDHSDSPSSPLASAIIGNHLVSPLATQSSSLLSAAQTASHASIAPAPLFQQFDPYGYDRALHRRRAKRSLQQTPSTQIRRQQPEEITLLTAPTNRLLRMEEQQRILRYLREMEDKIYGFNRLYQQHQLQQDQIQRRVLFHSNNNHQRTRA